MKSQNTSGQRSRRAITLYQMLGKSKCESGNSGQSTPSNKEASGVNFNGCMRQSGSGWTKHLLSTLHCS